jgi:hypothetical protein
MEPWPSLAKSPDFELPSKVPELPLCKKVRELCGGRRNAAGNLITTHAGENDTVTLRYDAL